MSAQYAVIKLTDLPPSVNALFANKKGGRFKTSAYKNWLHDAGWELKEQKPPHVPGPYAVDMRFGRKNKRTDLDNMLKATMDLLVAHHVVADDCLCKKIVAEWVTEPGVHIMVVSTKEVA
jgi:Holliday junction resolvase RusA-like endonuclease